MKRYGLYFVIILALSGYSFGQSFEKYAGEFLMLGAGSRAMGMAGAVTASVSDVSSGYWNPSALVEARGFQAQFMHSKQFISSIQNNYLGGSWQINSDNAVGITLLYLTVNSIKDSRNAYNYQDNKVDYSRLRYFNTGDYGFFLSFARRYSEKLSYGLNVKFLLRDYEINSALGIGFDAGLRYKLLHNLTLGMMVRDITTTMMVWSTDTKELIKPSIRLGTAYLLNLESLDISVQPSVDFQLYFENRTYASQAHLAGISLDTFWGTEIKYNELLALRLGVDEMMRFNSGIGLQLSKVAFDYAFTAYESELGNIHRISCHVSFDKLF